MSDAVPTTGGANDDQPRDGKGKFIRTLEGAQRDAEACRLRVAGKTYQEIADELGYGNKGDAHKGVQRALADTMREPADELRALSVARAEERYLLARGIANKNHYAHGNGKLVYKDGEPLLDDGPKLQALDRMERSADAIAKLRGLYAPQKFENLSLEAVQAEIARLEAEAKAEGEELP